ncbi:lactonase family protein [Pseudomonas sp. v388]|uniref:lactonase family protein n=1 Tax=Pseudomonas sp. v388 TaxID=2479849 RepID=UPI000F79B4AE|nr:lactonase family protein [Pseudomonas sp. v388]RRV05549.1 lactonase family protein [Pseudomonas sp. v388]
MSPLSLRWMALASALGAASLQAQPMTDVDLLVGTYTQGKSEGIYRLGFNRETGQIDPAPRQVIKSENPSWLTLSKDQRFLFAVNENGPGQSDVVGKVSSFAIDPKTHGITALSQVKSHGDEPTHSSLSPDGRYLFVANYAVNPDPGGVLAVLPVDKNGKLAEPVQTLPLGPASKVNAERQASSHVHAALPTPDGKYLVAADLGADKLFVYRYEEDGAKPLQPAKVPTVQLPGGSGPRHLLFSRAGKHAWLVLEMSAEVVVFEYHDGEFKQTQRVDLKNQGVTQKNGAGGLHTSPDGRFLYVANRGDANQLLVFRIDPTTGNLDEIQRRSVEGKEPREFSVDPSGNFMLFANQKSNQIVTVRRDPQTGMLGDTVQKFDLDSPSDLHFFKEE